MHSNPPVPPPPAGVYIVRAMLLATCLTAVGWTVLTGSGEAAVSVAALLALVVALPSAWHSALSRWHVLFGIVVGVILFVPIRRYQFVVDLPFDLEPYRIALAALVALWLSALLIDRRLHLKRSGLEAPLLLYGAAVLGSILTNFDRILGPVPDDGRAADLSLSSDVAKKLLFLLSFYLVLYFVVSMIDSVEAIHAVLKILVGGATVLAAFAVIEARTQYNVFDHLEELLPILSFEGELGGIERGDRLRVYASAQHPIALAAVLVMMLPLALYLARVTRHRRWWGAGALIGLATLGTVSRTGVVMLATIVVVFLVLRRAELRRFVPLLVPAIVVVHLALPGVMSTFRANFFPPGGLVQEQTSYQGRASSERIGGSFDTVKGRPLVGQGFGTRIPAGPRQNTRVLDNEWLATTVETGLVGLAAWIWLFGRFARRAGGEAKRDTTARGLLLAALVSAVLAYAVGMVTYDAFSFIQVTFVMFIMLGLGMSALAQRERWPELEPLPAPAGRLGRSPA